MLLSDTVVSVSAAGGGGSPASADDYTAVETFDVTITAGETSGQAAFTLTVTDDNTVEGDETITLTGTTATAAITAVNSTDITIDDDDDRLVLTVSSDEAAEGGAAAEVTVTASLTEGTAAPSEDAVVRVSAAGGGDNPASAGDYTAVEPFDVTITAGETSGEATFTLAVTDDNIAEGDETLIVSGAAEASGFNTVDGAVVTITDNDAAPAAVTLTASPDTVNEGGEPTEITVTAAFPEDSAVLPSDTVVSVSAAGGGDNPASAGDYTAVEDFDLTIPAGEISGEATFTLTVTDDLEAENPEELIVSGAAEGFTVAGAAITITDEKTVTDQAPPTSIDLSVSPSVVGESGAPVSITVTASFPTGADTISSDAAVTVSVAAGTAEAADFTAVTDFTVTITSGQTSGSASFNLTVADDGVDEDPDTLTVSGVTTAAGIAQVNGATITITDSGIAPLDSALCSDGTYVTDPATNTGLVSDCQALVAIRNHWTNDADNTDLRPTLHLRTWSGAITAWSGVTVSSQRVTGLELRPGSNLFTGRIEGSLPAELGNLTNLTNLNLSANSFTGDIPTQLGSLTSLTDLNLSFNRLTGTIPTQLGSLTSLIKLNLSFNRLTGTIPTQLGSLTSLTDLDLSYNHLTGGIPAQLGPLAPTPQGQGALTTFKFCRNNLSGALPAALRSVSTLDDVNHERISDCRRSVDLSIKPARVSEDSGTTAMTVKAHVYGFSIFDAQYLLEGITVTVSVAGGGGSPAGTGDFTAVDDFDLTIAARAASGEATFDLTVTNDSDQEGDETLIVSGAAGYPVNTAAVTILANDSAPSSIDLSVDPAAVGEADGAVDITVTAAFPAGSTPRSAATAVAVTVGKAGDSAAASGSGQDYSTDKTNNQFTVTIAAGAVSGSAAFSLTPVKDDNDEGAETLSVSGVLAGFTIDDIAVTITDSGIAPLDPARCSDGTFVSSPALNAGLVSECRTLLTIRNHWTNNKANADLGPDHPLRTWSGNMAAWSGVRISGQKVTRLTLTNPSSAETQSKISGAIPAQMGDLSGLTFLWLYNNSLSGPLPSEMANLTELQDLYIDNNKLTGSIPVWMASFGDLIQLSVSNNRFSGTIPTQLGNMTNLKRLYLDNNWLTGTIPAELGNITNLGVLYVQGNQLTGGIPAQLGNISRFRFAFCGNNLSGSLPPSLQSKLQGDHPPLTLDDYTGEPGGIGDCRRTIDLVVNPADVEESSGRTDIAVSAGFSGGSTWHEDLTVTVSVSDGTAAAGSDFTAVDSFDVTIPAGEPTSAGGDTFTLAVTDDAQAEAAETVAVAGAGTVAWMRFNPTVVTIEANDSAATSIDLSIDPASVNEQSGQTRITVTAAFPEGSAALSTAVTVRVSVKSSIAVAGRDFTAVQPFDITIAAGRTSAAAAFDLTVTDDNEAEGAERLTVAGEADGFTVNSAHLTIVDDESGAVPISLSVSPDSVSEGAGSPEITVTAAFPQGTTPPGAPTTVRVSVAGGTAAAGSDFTAVAGFDLTIAAGTRTGTARFNLPITDDDQMEATETVIVSGASPGFNISSAVVSITDNDVDPPTTVALSVSPESLSEGAGSPEITVSAAFPDNKSTLASNTEVTVSVGKSSDSAASGTDYTAVSNFTVEIEAGTRTGSAAFNLTITDDGLKEGAEAITVSGAASGFTVSDAQITIADNEDVLDPADCSDGTYVLDPTVNTGLAADCRALVAARNHWVNHPANASLADDHPLLTWGAEGSRRITEWKGVRVLSNRVYKLEMVTGSLRGNFRDQNLPGWGLGGTLPSQLGGLDALWLMLLSNNEFTGSIPAELGNLASLRRLYLNGNSLSGPIPAALGRLANLRELSLQSNQLSGGVPADLGDLGLLRTLYLNDNSLTGALPARLGDLAPPSGDLEFLRIDYPGLQGPLPAPLLGLKWIDLAAYDDPLGLIALADFSKQASTGAHRWTVWRCDLRGTLTIDQSAVAGLLNREITPFFGWMSENRYTPTFAAGGSVRAADRDSCEDHIPNNDELTRLLIVDNTTSNGGVNRNSWQAVLTNEPPTNEIELRTNITVGGGTVVSNTNTRPRLNTVAHEIGHGLQWPHSYGGRIVYITSREVYQYDHPMDLMSGRAGPDPNVGTIAVNRYASGWIDPDDVEVHSGGAASYELSPLGIDGTQMLVVPTGEGQGVFYTLGVRVKKDYDTGIIREGVEVYLVDQRPRACNPARQLLSLCFSVSRRTIPIPRPSSLPIRNNTRHVYGVGRIIDLGGVSAAVTRRRGDRFEVRLSENNASLHDLAQLFGHPTSVDLNLSLTSTGEGAGNRRITVTASFPSDAGRFRVAKTVRVSVADGSAAAGSDFREVDDFEVMIGAQETSGSASFTLYPINDNRVEGPETIRITGASPGLTVSSALLTITDNDTAPPAPPAPPPPPASGGGGSGGGSGSGGSGGGGSGGGGSGGGGAPPPTGGGGGGGAVQPPAAPAYAGRFRDEDGSVHQANIERIAQWQITLGCSATDPTLYCPSADITRRQMAAFLYRAVSQRWTIQAPARSELTDVGTDAWYRTYADWVISINAFTAPEGAFNPGGVVTRADMAIMMIAAFPHLEAAAEPEGLFQDAQDADPAVIRAIEGMYQTGVTRGCSTTPLNYCPDQPVTRAQMASFFVRALDQAPDPTPQTASAHAQP